MLRTTPVVVAQIPTGVALAEAEFNRRIRHPRMLATEVSQSVAGDDSLLLPTDFIQAKSLVLVDTSINRPLVQYSTTGLDRRFASSNDGVPEGYAILGNGLRFGPTPDTNYTVKLV